jgi:hypothetical protein
MAQDLPTTCGIFHRLVCPRQLPTQENQSKDAPFHSIMGHYCAVDSTRASSNTVEQ